jgi:hypothetical protein
VQYNIKFSTDDALHNGDNDNEFFFIVSHVTCQIMGYLIYFFGLLMFTWMSVLCFDLMR